MPEIRSNNNRSLIIGGFGFVGYHLASNLLRRGESVVIFGHKPELMTEFRALEKKYAGSLEFSYGEVIGQLHEAFAHGDDIQHVYHLAARKQHSGVMAGKEEGAILAYNYDTDIEVFDVCEVMTERRPVKLLYMSTGEVYGNAFLDNGAPIYETHSAVLNPQQSKHIYPLSKLAGETMLIHGGWNFQWTIARLQNPYGPRMGEHMFITKVMQAAFEQLPFFVAMANDSRPYIYIDDACNAFSDLMVYPSSVGGTYNVAAEMSTNNSTVCELIAEIAGSHTFLQYPVTGRPTNRNVAVSRIHEVSDWHEKVTMKEGLKRTWDYYLPHFATERAINSSGLRV